MDVALTAFDLTDRLFTVLQPLKEVISGGIYVDDRPDNSGEEDIVINCLTISAEYSPQEAVCNINIHVPDLRLSISGRQQFMANRERLRELYLQTAELLDGVKYQDAQIRIENYSTMKEQGIEEHFVNIRVAWAIYAVPTD